MHMKKYTSMRAKINTRWSNFSSAADNVVTKNMRQNRAKEMEIDGFLKEAKSPYNLAKVKSLSPKRDSFGGGQLPRGMIGT